jgi:hypothetical protein
MPSEKKCIPRKIHWHRLAIVVSAKGIELELEIINVLRFLPCWSRPSVDRCRAGVGEADGRAENRGQVGASPRTISSSPAGECRRGGEAVDLSPPARPSWLCSLRRPRCSTAVLHGLNPEIEI